MPFSIIHRLLAALGLTVQRTRPAEQRLVQFFRSIRALTQHENPLIADLAKNVLRIGCQSRSQVLQDILVTTVLGGKEGGFFVEFGAADGVLSSNTYMLEKEFGWSGILAEPAKAFHDALIRNRPNAMIDSRCVYRSTGETLVFRQTRDPHYSTVASFTHHDHHAQERSTGFETYEVDSVSLMDLVTEHGAPNRIDYLSIDTEGSEYDILSQFDFTKYSFNVLTVEHNFTAAESKIDGLLRDQGYTRVLRGISLYDGWYVSDDTLQRSGYEELPFAD